MSADKPAYNVLIIDDSPEDAELYRRTLTLHAEVQYTVVHAVTGSAGLKQYLAERPDCVLLDYNLPDMDGVEFMHNLAKVCGPHYPPVVMLTGQGSESIAVEAMKRGACDYLNKGAITRDLLDRVIRNGIERCRVMKEFRRLALGVESAGEAIMMSDTDGVIDYVNPAFTRLTGYAADEVIGQNPRILQSGRHPKSFYEQMWKTIKSGQAWTGQVINRCKDGEVYDAQLTIAPVTDHDTQVLGFVSVHNNITPLKKAHEALGAANRALEQKNEKLTELTQTAHRFVDNVAHDFRTPLTVIKEFSSIIADGLGGPVTEEQNEFLQFIITATRDLSQMVDDFLDSSKLKAGVLRVNREPRRVDQMIGAVRSILKSRAALKKIVLVEDVQTDLPMVFADAEKIERVIINLVINAIKFSDEGSAITLWAKTTDDGDVEIGVTDKGPGLSADDLAVIFERFKQVGDIQRASTKGFGLGLNIAKELVWLNLGTVYVRSQQGQGSTFSFTLPTCDQPVILRRYFERFEELNEPPVNIAILEAKTALPLADPDELRQFLTSVCYPMDLVLKGQEEGSVVVIGATTEPQLWIDRLLKARVAKADKGKKDKAVALHISCLESTPYTQIKDRVYATSLADIPELRHCA